MWHIPYTIPLSHSCMHPWPASRPQGAGGQCTMLPPTNLGLASFRTDPEIGRDGSPDQTPHMPVSIGPFVPRARQAGGVWRPALGACHLARRHTFCRPPATPPVPPTGGPRPGMSITSCGARRVDRVLTAAEDSSAWRARWLLDSRRHGCRLGPPERFNSRQRIYCCQALGQLINRWIGSQKFCDLLLCYR